MSDRQITARWLSLHEDPDKHHEEWIGIQAIDLDPLSHTFDTGDHKSGQEIGCLCDVILNKSGLQENVTRLVKNFDGSLENKMKAEKSVRELIEFVCTVFPGGWEQEEEPKHLDHLWAIGVIMHHMVCGQPETGGDADKEEFCRNTNPGTRQTAREMVKDNTNSLSPDNWSQLRNSAKKLIKDLTNFNPGNRPFLCDLTTGSWGDDVRKAFWDKHWPFEVEWIESTVCKQSKTTSHCKKNEEHCTTRH